MANQILSVVVFSSHQKHIVNTMTFGERKNLVMGRRGEDATV